MLVAACMLAGVNAAAQTFTVDGINYNVTSENDMSCEVATTSGLTGDVTIPEQVTAGGKTYTVTAVGNVALSRNAQITSVKLPGTVKVIGNGAFYSCENMTSIDLGGSVEMIYPSAFQGCGSLTSINLPETLTAIGEDGFSSSGLTSLVIPNSVTEVDSRVFASCKNLKSVVINCAVTSDYMLSWCLSLEEVTIGSGITSIAPGMFQMCPNLKTVTMLGSTPPAIIGYDVFYNVPLENATLRVPAGSLSAYKDAQTWSDFGTIVEFTPTGISNSVAATDFAVKATGGVITVSGVEGEVSVYDVSGAKVAGATADGGVTIAVPAHGIYVVKAGGKTVKVAM